MRILLDTNVMIDYYAPRNPDNGLARTFLIMHEFGDAQFWVSAKSFTDMFYVLRKKFSASAIQRAFLESLNWVNVCSIDSADIKLASEREWKDFEDCLVAISAEKIKADLILTRNEKDFAQSSIPTSSPKAFIDMMRDELGIVYDEIDLPL